MLKNRINTIKIKYYILLWEQDAGGSNPFTPTRPAVSNSRAAGFSMFVLLCPRFKRVSFFNASQRADCRRQTAHSTLWCALFCSCAENTDFYGSFQLKPRRVSRVRGFFFIGFYTPAENSYPLRSASSAKGFFPAARITASLALAGSRFPNSYFSY